MRPILLLLPQLSVATASGTPISSPPPRSCLAMSGEERMAILKEVEAHLELLKEFVGVIPDNE